MNSAEPLVHPKQLRQAREAVSLTASLAAAEVGVPEDTVLAWEAGTAEPSVEQVEALARIYGRSVDYFLDERPGLPQEVFLRTATAELQTTLTSDVRKVLVEFEELCRYEWELEQLAGIENPVRFSPQPGKPPDELVEFERDRAGLDSQPIKNLRDLLGRQGIRVFWLPIPGSALAGLSWWHMTYGPCVLVNIHDSPGRRSFTMAHEYGHLLSQKVNSMTVCDLSEDIDAERVANRFAVLFLMPGADVLAYWQSHVSELEEVSQKTIGNMAQRYSVSVEALAIRLQELGLIPSADWLLQHGQPRAYGKRPPDWRRTRGDRFVAKALRAYSRQRLSAGKLAEYLGINIRKAIELGADAAGSDSSQ